MLKSLLNASRYRHYFTFNLGKTYRMDVRQTQDASTENATLSRYSSGTCAL